MLSGCAAAPTVVLPVVPRPVEPVAADQVRAWVEPTVPTGNRVHRIKWNYKDKRSSVGGRGSIRVAAPDSVRIDVAGPLGAGRSAALVVGDSALWADPRDLLDKFVPSYPLMWALFGVARMPAADAELGALLDGDLTVWQYVTGADTLQYVRVAGPEPRFLAEARRAGLVVGRTEFRVGPDGAPASAKLFVPNGSGRLEITFVSSTAPDSFPPDTWRPRQP